MNKEDIIERIGIARNNANLSARALSLKIGMNDGYINRLETTKKFLPSVEVLLKIIEACGISEEQFFYNDFYRYKQDREMLAKLGTINNEKMQAIITLLR